MRCVCVHLGLSNGAHEEQFAARSQAKVEARQVRTLLPITARLSVFIDGLCDRIYLGRNGVMRKALGSTVEDEYRQGSHKIGTALTGDVGLLFTNSEPAVVIDWFKDFTRPDFARTGNVAPQAVVIPVGPIMMSDTVAPHSIEPQLRKLGMATKLVKGVPTLDVEHTICKKGETLEPNQVNLLKLFGHCLATVSCLCDQYEFH